MYTIEHLSDESWTPEVTRETEFKAFVDARTKCLATGKIYRVVDDKRNVRYKIHNHSRCLQKATFFKSLIAYASRSYLQGWESLLQLV